VWLCRFTILFLILAVRLRTFLFLAALLLPLIRLVLALLAGLTVLALALLATLARLVSLLLPLLLALLATLLRLLAFTIFFHSLSSHEYVWFLGVVNGIQSARARMYKGTCAPSGLIGKQPPKGVKRRERRASY
jgi:hypothetical protein